MGYPSWLSVTLIIWNCILFIAEISIGLRTHSPCPLVYGLHSLYKTVEGVIYLVCKKVPQTGTNTNTFGWARAMVLGVTINSVFFAALCFSMFVSALKRLISPEHLHDPLLITIVGGAGVGSGLISFAASFIHSLGSKVKRKYASDGSSAEQIEMMIAKGSNDTGTSRLPPDIRWVVTNMAAALIVLTDGLIQMFGKGRWTLYVDTVASIFMIAVVVGGTLPKFRHACLVLMQAVPGHLQVVELKEKLLKEVPAIESIHEFHLWQLTGRHYVSTVHIRLSRVDEFVRIADQVKAFMKGEGIQSVTVQPEVNGTIQGDYSNNNLSCLLECGPKCLERKCCCNTSDSNT